VTRGLMAGEVHGAASRVRWEDAALAQREPRGAWPSTGRSASLRRRDRPLPSEARNVPGFPRSAWHRRGGNG